MKDEVRELKECVKKLEGELAQLRILANCCQTDSSTWTDSAGLMLSTLDMSVELAGIPQGVPASDLEKTFAKILEKVTMEVTAKNIDACHRVGKQGLVIVKFLRRKDIKKIAATDLDLPITTIKLYLNESLCPYYRIFW